MEDFSIVTATQYRLDLIVKRKVLYTKLNCQYYKNNYTVVLW